MKRASISRRQYPRISIVALLLSIMFIAPEFVIASGFYFTENYGMTPVNETQEMYLLCADNEICTFGVLKPDVVEDVIHRNINSSGYNPYFESYEDYTPDIVGTYVVGFCTTSDCIINYTSFNRFQNRLRAKEYNYQREINELQEENQKLRQQIAEHETKITNIEGKIAEIVRLSWSYIHCILKGTGLTC